MSSKISLKLTLAALLLLVTWTLGAPPASHAETVCGDIILYQYSGGGSCVIECDGQEKCLGNHTGTIVDEIPGQCTVC